MDRLPQVGDVIRIKPRPYGDSFFAERVFALDWHVANVLHIYGSTHCVDCKNTEDTNPVVVSFLASLDAAKQSDRFPLECIELVTPAPSSVEHQVGTCGAAEVTP